MFYIFINGGHSVVFPRINTDSFPSPYVPKSINRQIDSSLYTKTIGSILIIDKSLSHRIKNMLSRDFLQDFL
jgi:hypothetical protein